MDTSAIDIPHSVIDKWQEITNLLAELVQVPAALIKRIEPPEIRVLVASASPGNPYRPRERACLNTGLYCETVMRTRQLLLVPDALEDDEWGANPDLKLGMISYLGVPISWPNGDIFGTICVLNRKRNAYHEVHHRLLLQLRDAVQADLLSVSPYEARLAAEKRGKACLEAQMTERTTQLAKINHALSLEVEEHKRAAAALRESEQRYRSSVENALEGIIRISHDGRVMAANPALARMLGYGSPDEMIAERTVEAGLVRANLRARAAELSTRPSPDAVSGYETELHGKEGRSIWVLLSSRLVRDASGEPIYTECFITDLTERKRADQERQDHIWFLESMEKVNRAIQGTNDLEQMTSDVLSAVLSIFACDRAWLVYPCDPEAASWRAVMEHTRPDYPGAFALGIDLPIDAEVANVFQTARASSGAVQFRSKSARPVPAQLAERFGIQSMIVMTVYPKVAKPYLFGLHQCAYPRIWTAWEERLFQEVGHRLGDGLTGLLMLRSLRESEAKLEEAQRIAHVGYWDHDLDTNFVTWSTESLRIFGLPQQNGGVAFTRYPELLHPDDRQRVVSAVAEALRGGARYEVEYRVVRPSGEVRIVHSQGDVVRDEAGRPRRMFGIVQDITERRHAEEALRDVQADLARVARLTTLGELAASLAHEINQPLAAIATSSNACLRWLNRDQPDLASARDAASRVVRDAHRAGDVIRSLRSLTRKSGPQLTRLDIRDAIKEVLALTRGESQRQSVVLHTNLAAEGWPVLGDRVQLQQVLLNLIMNAIQAMAAVNDRRRELTVTVARAEPDLVQVWVEDTGPGLDPAIESRIFDPFFTTKSDGLGMGLSICRSIIEAHGGQLRGSSRAPHGAAFHFTIPVAVEM